MRNRRSSLGNFRGMRAAPHFPSLQSRPEISPELHMFIEDVGLGVMPWPSGCDEEKRYEIQITGEEEYVAKAERILMSLARSDRANIEDLVSDAIGNVVHHVSWFGRALYEILLPANNKKQCMLKYFTDKRLLRMPLYYIQFIPRSDQELYGRRINFIPSEKVWEIRIPDRLGGYRKYRSLQKGLNQIQGFAPNFFRRHLEEKGHMPDISLETYWRETEVHKLRITNRWGWNGRETTQKYWTEFMYLYRTLTFEWARTVLREHVVVEINKLLHRLAIDATLEVSGLPTADDILDIREKMSAGELGFDEAYKAAST